MKKTKMEKGITLVALIITIVILLILAVVAISSITKDDILGKAENATKKYNQSVENEKEMMNEYEKILNDLDSTGDSSDLGENSDNTAKIVDTNGNDVKNTVISITSNTDVYDTYGNKIVVPAGFKIVVNADTNNADTVTKGIVIEDSIGNQFVWIPLGKIYTDTERTEENAKKITLGRYSFDSSGVASTYSGGYTEDTVSNHTKSNAIAKDIGAFVTSATNRGGYYIGRYEARQNTSGKLTNVPTDSVWYNVTQKTASSESKAMYVDGYASGTFSSDLINSYAWDTAIVFLQTFDNRPKEKKTIPYSKQNSLNTSFSLTGTTEDIICNVYDMASNCYEWTTETSNATDFPCVWRGSHYEEAEFLVTEERGTGSVDDAERFGSFRTILYVA